jgi:hypothetical protein
MSRETPALASFRQDILSHLPQSVKSALSERPLTIEFMDWQPRKIPSPCPAPSSTDLENQKEIRIRLGFAPSRFLQNSKTRRIQLHSGFLTHITPQADLDKQDFACGHKSFYRWALATALHEIIHLYDFENVPAHNDPQEIRQRAQCRKEQAQRGRGQARILSPECRRLLQQQHSISDRDDFLNIASFKSGFIQKKSLNVLHKTSLQHRSPDPYEFTNPQEALAVNMEYFLLDPEYACRRPQMARFLSKAFQLPPPQASCDSFRRIRISSSHQQINIWQDLDPSRVYQIHYLLAGPGEKTMSRFGHSMFRIILCAPERKEASEACLNDISHHIVVSYRADVSSLEINSMDGVLGKYPSMLFLLRLPEVITEYNYGEDRDLYSIPLLLNSSEKTSFIERVVENFWEYRGRYFFLTNNCATESANFLWGALAPFRSDLRTSSPIITPQGVGQALARYGLIEGSWDIARLEQEGTRSVHFFPAAHRHGVMAFQKLLELQAIPSHLNAKIYLDELQPQQRRELYTQAKAKFVEEPQVLRQIALNFYALENIRRQRVMAIFKNELIEVFESLKDTPKLQAEINRVATESFSIRDKLLPWNVAQAGYGIPSQNETLSAQVLSKNEARMFELQNQALEQLKELPFVASSEMNSVRENLQFYMNEIKSMGR